MKSCSTYVKLIWYYSILQLLCYCGIYFKYKDSIKSSKYFTHVWKKNSVLCVCFNFFFKCFAFSWHLILINYIFSLFFGFADISASVNVLVQNCKIYNDASCDISADGQLLAAFIPSSQRGFPDEGILAVYSLAPHNLGEMLYTKRFGKCVTKLIFVQAFFIVI